MSYYVLHSNLSRDLVGTDKKKCSWKREYFYRSPDGRLAVVTECEDGFLYRSPAIYRLTPNTDKPADVPQPQFKELPGVELLVPAGAVPCAADDYEAALARCLKAEKKSTVATWAYKNRVAAVLFAPAEAPAAVVAEPVPAAPVRPLEPPAPAYPLDDYTVLDLEFFNPGGGRPGVLIELAAARFTHGQPAGQVQHLIALPPGQFVPARISEHTGITTAMLRGQPAERDVLMAFRELAGNSTIIAHNFTADRTQLEQARTRQGAKAPLPNAWLCTLTGSRILLPGQPSYSLSPLCRALGIEAHGAHRALRDVEMCAALLRHLQGLPAFRIELLQPGATPAKSKAKTKAKSTPDLFIAA